MRVAFLSAAACLAALPLPAPAQDAATIATAEHPDHGIHLTDGAGWPLYLFKLDGQGGPGKDAVSKCADACVGGWPPLLAIGTPTVAGEAKAELIGSIQRADGGVQLTYNGWPLYYYWKDPFAGEMRGHDVVEFGGEWSLVTPAGEAAGD